MTQKPGCVVGCVRWIPISTLQDHSLYLWWENGRVEMLWIAWISPNSLNLGVKTEKHIVVTILEHTYQSQPYPTIHYTYNEKLERLTCCQLLESIQTYSIMVWNVGYWSPNRHFHDSKARVCRWLREMNSNLNIGNPFIIYIINRALSCPSVCVCVCVSVNVTKIWEKIQKDTWSVCHPKNKKPNLGKLRWKIPGLSVTSKNKNRT